MGNETGDLTLKIDFTDRPSQSGNELLQPHINLLIHSFNHLNIHSFLTRAMPAASTRFFPVLQ